ncbi:Pex16 family peroxisome import protein [Schizosaccharomyces cryophilus OY26]|uniref:Peroxisomal membrane protein PEX16 n=1 Tax=Schizosaccharomyces cryophilus (strain OY26 / ATCC MYA-4695 / CBS 11777 / NBRC 106824 / NRRL Y48691) TaxID=653667 RepID=S9W2M8_SCHCR|nr:Pex16 family peroxisome import protein [Schizosaccharomyces cryophilus OY26]EPY54303.1 Pex16 family peroxisome import protein [Schizosaccharomyces cryophilus OY26]
MNVLSLYEKHILADERSFTRVSEIEKILKYMAYFLPAEFRTNELSSQTISSVLLFLQQFHTDLLYRKISELPEHEQRSLKSERTLFIEYFNKRSPYFQISSRLLFLVNNLSLPTEILTAKLHPLHQYDTVLSVESLKLLLRLHLMYLTGGHLPFRNPLLTRDFNSRNFINIYATYNDPKKYVTLKKTGKKVPRLHSVPSSFQQLNQSTPKLHNLLLQSSSSQPLGALRIISNLLRVFRPFIYMLLTWHWKRTQLSGKSPRNRPWLPWILSLIMETSSLYLNSKDSNKSSKSLPMRVEASSNQSAFRDYIIWSLTHGRFFDEFTRQWLKYIIRWVDPIPFVGRLFNVYFNENAYRLENYVSSANF